MFFKIGVLKNFGKFQRTKSVLESLLAVIYRAADVILYPSLKNKKQIHSKKSFFIFLKKAFLIFQEMEPPKNLLYFRKKLSELEKKKNLPR